MEGAIVTFASLEHDVVTAETVRKQQSSLATTYRAIRLEDPSASSHSAESQLLCSALGHYIGVDSALDVVESIVSS